MPSNSIRSHGIIRENAPQALMLASLEKLVIPTSYIMIGSKSISPTMRLAAIATTFGQNYLDKDNTSRTCNVIGTYR